MTERPTPSTSKDPAATSLTWLRQLAAPLTSLSKQFEPFVPGSDPGPVGALTLLGTLERVARESLEPVAAPPEPIQVETTKPATSRPQAPPVNASRFGTKKKEYRPALQDPSVIQALLALQGQPARPSVAAAAARAAGTTSTFQKGRTK